MVKGNQETLQAAGQEALVQALEEEDPQLRRCGKTEKKRDRQPDAGSRRDSRSPGLRRVPPVAGREDDRRH
jgi:hypothetical protein